jgi:hypothetical protein
MRKLRVLLLAVRWGDSMVRVVSSCRNEKFVEEMIIEFGFTSFCFWKSRSFRVFHLNRRHLPKLKTLMIRNFSEDEVVRGCVG